MRFVVGLDPREYFAIILANERWCAQTARWHPDPASGPFDSRAAYASGYKGTKHNALVKALKGQRS